MSTTLAEQISTLRSIKGRLSQRDSNFASDLLASYAKHNRLSPKQEPWVAVLIARVENPTAKPPARQVNVGTFTGVVELFNQAKAHLKFPKIVLVCEGQKVILSVAGDRSKTPGSINITGEGQFPNRQWFGRVDASGAWEPSRSTTPAMLAALETLLSALAADPARVAREHGRLTGQCCFCNLPLKDERSTAAGYGPVCAKHYGLESQWKEAAKRAA